MTNHADDGEFQRSIAEVESGMAAQRQLRAELTFEEEPPPRRLAPHAYAVAATALAEPEGDTEIGWGKFVLLFDPAGQDGWDGKYRIIGYVRAELEPEMTADPLMNEVGWSWLTEALDTPGYAAASGTVTRVITESYGAKAGELPATGFELRASWSPEDESDLAGHVVAWCGCLAAAAGLEPPGTRALAPRRR